MGSRRVKYFGKNDLSIGWQLRRAEEILKNWDEYTASIDINSAIELFNIKRYFDNDIRLVSWDESSFTQYKGKCQEIPSLLGRFCSTLTDTSIESVYSCVDRDYQDAFWELIVSYKVNLKISAETMERILKAKSYAVFYVLRSKALVMHFGETLATTLKDNPRTAEWLISHYLTEHTEAEKQMYFPKELSSQMRNQLLNDYIDSCEANANYLQLIAGAQSTTEFPVDDRLKLKALEKLEDIQEKHFKSGYEMSYGVAVSFKSIPDGSVEYVEEDNVYHYRYSREWVEENQDFAVNGNIKYRVFRH